MVDPKKTKAVQKWPRPTTPTEIRSFLGLAGYNMRFVQDFSRIAAALTKLTQKNAKFQWTEECVQKLKTCLTTAPILALPSGSGGFTVFSPAKRLLAKVIQRLEDTGIRFSVGNSEALLACAQAKSSLVERIKATQYEDERLCKYRDEFLAGKSKDMIVESDAVLRMGDRLCVADVDGLRHDILEEAHNSKYTIHPGSTKIGYDSVWVIVDRLTKSAPFLPVKTTYGRVRYAQIFMNEIVRIHGVPISVISNRGSQFTSRFWKSFQEALGTRVDLITTFHPQTDGHSERTIQILVDMLRACILDFGGSWDAYLPLA
ncbi:PREDICTED: uncharacterized protein LOC109224204 [Nicotiana attenuata]|uniref:uncharacterized protein LOC109224204 n=1 Tax=Nicotiana attenuata TaxID=49451 RepID=UPI000905936C|nr:PREDICTED: uncharacterized protein LOC109224204 [Nicotiana attenuata]